MQIHDPRYEESEPHFNKTLVICMDVKTWNACTETLLLALSMWLGR